GAAPVNREEGGEGVQFPGVSLRPAGRPSTPGRGPVAPGGTPRGRGPPAPPPPTRYLMPRSARPPFHADHVGSLLRPTALKTLRVETESGRANARELRAAEDQAIREVVGLQESVGLHGITDGELRRTSWHLA